jgi:hypothetical protein
MSISVPTQVIPSFQECAFSAYVAAYDHAQMHSRCAHVSCGILVDGVLIGITTNTAALHAEMEALKMISEMGHVSPINESSSALSSEKQYRVLPCFERGSYQHKSKGYEKSKDRLDRRSLSQKWRDEHGETMFGVSTSDSNLWNQVCVL